MVAKKADGLFYLRRMALKKGLIDDLWKRKAATSATALAAILLSMPVLDAALKEIRRSSGYNPEPDELARIIRGELVRLDLLTAK